MSVTVLGLAWYVSGLSASQKSVLLALADQAGEDGRHAYPGVKRLAAKTSCGERTVIRALKHLEETGLIVTVSKAAPGRATEYLIDLEVMRERQDRKVPERPPLDATHAAEAHEHVPERPPSSGKGAGAALVKVPERHPNRPNKNTKKEKGDPSDEELAAESENITTALVEGFCDLTGLSKPFDDRPDEWMRNWLAPLRHLFELCGKDVDATLDLMGLAVAHMDKKDLSIARPSSIEKVAVNLHRRGPPKGGPGKDLDGIWQQVVDLSARGKLTTLPEGPIRTAVNAVGAARIHEMTVYDKSTIREEFSRAYGRASR